MSFFFFQHFEDVITLSSVLFVSNEKCAANLIFVPLHVMYLISLATVSGSFLSLVFISLNMMCRGVFCFVCLVGFLIFILFFFLVLWATWILSIWVLMSFIIFWKFLAFVKNIQIFLLTCSIFFWGGRNSIKKYVWLFHIFPSFLGALFFFLTLFVFELE